MKVLKFGGSSVENADCINKVIDILEGYYQKGDKFTVVFSAFKGVTDALIEMSKLAAAGDESYLKLFEQFQKRHYTTAEDLLDEKTLKAVTPELLANHDVLKNLLYGIFLVREASPRTMDYVLSFGERNSSFIIANALKSKGINASYLDARKIIKTDKSFGAAKVDFDESYKKIKAYFSDHPEINITTGFIGSSKGGLTTTLGRGGSDFTAAILAAGLDASVIEIWTDVDGVLTADPRKVSKAFTIPSMSYMEAMEMSHFGAKVIYPPTLQPALAKKIPLKIKNTFNPEFEGTLISEKVDESASAVKGISSITEIALLTLSGSGMFGVPGIAGRLFQSLANAGINIILITQGSSEHSISFAVQPSDSERAAKKVNKEFEYEMSNGAIENVNVEDNLSVIAIIGEMMRYRPGIAGRLFQALGKNGINIIAIAQGSSELNVSVVINKSNEQKALNALHETFFLSDTKALHLFMVGVGLIGSTLIDQIKNQNEFLREKRQTEIKIIGLANSRKMIFNDEDGIDLENWKDELDHSDEKMTFPGFVHRMKEMNFSNTIFVDNTANEEIANYYESILDASISISTPNKISTSSTYLQYQRLKNIATSRGVTFAYETNVGAGLPILTTIKDLINSGDRFLKIEGVLSGSLSFIFNTYEAGTKFSDIVVEAGKKGYTEPDPRIDLSGKDVRRKLIILAREIGLNMEAKDVDIKSILPKACEEAETVDAFFKELEKADNHFEKMRADAAKENKKLRMIAQLDNGKATISMQAVDASHPFYSLSGSDNMIVFTTERYKDRPLVIRGPGAGAEVTAAGVFAEILAIGSSLT